LQPRPRFAQAAGSGDPFSGPDPGLAPSLDFFHHPLLELVDATAEMHVTVTRQDRVVQSDRVSAEPTPEAVPHAPRLGTDQSAGQGPGSHGARVTAHHAWRRGDVLTHTARIASRSACSWAIRFSWMPRSRCCWSTSARSAATSASSVRMRSRLLA